MSNSYLDFELQIELTGDGGYHAAVLASPAGETLAPQRVELPFDARDLERLRLKLENALLRSRTRSRRALSVEERTIKEFGSQLFGAIFKDDVRALYYESRREAERDGQGLRLKLRIGPPELVTLPWEFLHEPREDEYICLSRVSPIIRYLELPQPIPPLAVKPPLRILGMVSSPVGLPELDVRLEKEHVEAATASLRASGLVELHWLESDTVLDLQRALRRPEREPWHIFHFIGHGGFDAARDEGVLWLSDRDGRPQAVTASQLGTLLGDHRRLRLAVLNACEGGRSSELDIFSSTAATLVRRGVPAILAMQYEISDNAAILLAEMFYESLADGLSVDAAIAEARKAISLANANTLEWGTPVLYMRARDGRIFDIELDEVSTTETEEPLVEAEEPTSGEPMVPDGPITAVEVEPDEAIEPQETVPQITVTPQQLARLIADLFDEGELRSLCFDLEVEYEDLPGQRKRVTRPVSWCDTWNGGAAWLNWPARCWNCGPTSVQM